MLGPVAFQVLVGIEEAKVVAKSIVFGVVRRVVRRSFVCLVTGKPIVRPALEI